MSSDPIYRTDFPKLKFLRRGKVRDLYDLGEFLPPPTASRRTT